MRSVEHVLPRAEPGILSPPFQATSLGLLALVSLLAFEQLALATVMPVVAQALGDASLYAAAFGVAIAAGIVGMVLAGRWSDAAGPAPALWAGIAAFVLGLGAAGLAPSMPVLVLGRAVQGLGGGLMSVALYVVVGQHYPDRLHPRIFAAFAGAWVVPAVVGPALAGLIERQFGWRWVFLSAALLAVPAAWVLRRGLGANRRPAVAAAAKDTADKAGTGPAGPAGTAADRPTGLPQPGVWPAALATVAAVLLYAGTQPSPSQGVWVALALVGLALSAPRLLPAGSFAVRPGLPAVMALRGLAAAAFFTAEVVIPLMLIGQRGLSPVQAGLVLTVGALGWSAGSWFQGRDTRSPDEAACVRRLRLGLAAIAAGALSVTLVLLPAVPVGVAVVGWLVAGAGMGLVYPTLSVLTLRLAPGPEQGAASSALQLADSLFSAVGLALAGMLLAALQARSANAAYLAGFGLAAGLAALGALLAPRVRQAGPGGGVT